MKESSPKANTEIITLPNKSICKVSIIAILWASSVAAQNSSGNIYDNNGVIAQGQGGDNTVIQGQIVRHLNDNDKAKLLSHLPRERKIVILFANSQSDDEDFAKEFHDFLVGNGYTVEGPNSSDFSGPNGQLKGVHINLNQAHPDRPIEIIVGIRG
jgi:hypothetical protein